MFSLLLIVDYGRVMAADEDTSNVPEVHQLLIPRAPSALLFTHYASRLPPPEVSELRLVIGESLVSECESLHAEREAHIEILSSYRRDHHPYHLSHSTTSIVPPPPLTLGESSHQRVEREMLRMNITRALERIPSDPALVGGLLSDRERSIVRLFRSLADDSTPAALVPPFHPQTQHQTSRPSSRASSESSTAMVESVRSALDTVGAVGIDGVDAVVGAFREALVQEARALHEDIEFLIGCLEDEIAMTSVQQGNRDDAATTLVEAMAMPPSLKDLRELETKLAEYERTERLVSAVPLGGGTGKPPLKPIDRPASAGKKTSLSTRLRTQVEESRKI